MLGCSLASLISSLLIARHAPLAGLVLAPPALLCVAIYALATAQPGRGDAAARRRLSDVLAGFEISERLRVVVSDRTTVGLRLVARKPATLLASSGFVTATDDDSLRGAVAVAIGELRSVDVQRRALRRRRLSLAGGVAVGLPVGVLSPAYGWLLPIAILGFVVWLCSALCAAATRRPGHAHAYEGADDAAVTLVGNPAVVGRALLAVQRWHDEAHARTNGLTRLVARGIQPLPAVAHETARAARLASA